MKIRDEWETKLLDAMNIGDRASYIGIRKSLSETEFSIEVLDNRFKQPRYQNYWHNQAITRNERKGDDEETASV